ncbi:MAG: Fe-S cluster assembly protein SufD [Gammaproteobacteria bacterium]|nr:Fe-S cluster assembly protein SufD [Gammaproteobacteria bacterium]MCH9743615.1 Fe-S cluster assembly protein SufD [Gammaproteobacteria bacterium]
MSDTLEQQYVSTGLLARGFPTRQWEDWKYTDVSAITNHCFRLPEQLAVSAVPPLEKIQNSIRIVFVDGVLSEPHSELNLLPPGVTLEKPTKMAACTDVDQPFVQLNDALMFNGAVIKVADNIVVKPIMHLLFISTDSQKNAQCHWRHHLSLGRHTKLTLVEEYYSQSLHCYFNNIVNHLSVGAGAHLNYYKLQREGHAAFHIANTKVQQQADSHVESCSISLGASLSRDDVCFHLQEQGAECHLHGLFLAKDKRHIDHHTVIEHAASHCHSEQLYKGVASQQGRGVFNGKIVVPDAIKQTVAHQANHNLLLSNQAEIDTKPELQIYADDVECSHAATVGQLDENALFYLRSRGIDEARAKRILMAAFIEEVILKLQNQVLQQYIKQALLHKES